MYAIDRFLQKREDLLKIAHQRKWTNKTIKKASIMLFAKCRELENQDYHIAKVCNEIITKSK